MGNLKEVARSIRRYKFCSIVSPLRDVADVAYDYDSVRIRWSGIVLSAREPVNGMCRI